MAKALVPLANGFEDIEAVAVIDVLRRGGVEVVAAAVGDDLEVRSAHGIRMRADALLSAVSDGHYDAIVLPGGGEGTEGLKHSEAVHDLLRRQREADGLICAICAAPTVLVEAGIVGDETQMTCYPTCQLEYGREWAPAPVVADGTVITGQAPGSAVLFALVVLQHLVGVKTAAKVARGMVTDVLD